MSQVVSTRLPDRTAERLKRFARQLGKTPSETSAILIEESLRESEFPYIEFRHSPLGRQPYLKNSSLALWEVIQDQRYSPNNDQNSQNNDQNSQNNNENQQDSGNQGKGQNQKSDK